MVEPDPGVQHEPPESGAPPRASEARSLARDLTGDLRCLRCRYNLKGLSIRAACPECALPVRATILAIIDPLADEIAPLPRPRLTAFGLIAWTGAAFAAAACVWFTRASELLAAWRLPAPPTHRLAIVGLACVVLSGLGAIVLIRPIRSASGVARAALGVALYAPLAWIYWCIHAVIDAADPMPYTQPGSSHEMRVAWRLLAGALIAAIALALRTNARQLAARSFVFRSGQVDRQSMLGIVAAAAIAAAGDALNLLIGSGYVVSDLARTVSVALIALGSFLLTAGLYAMLVDVVRLFPILTSPPGGLRSILETNRQRDARAHDPPTPEPNRDRR